MGEPFAYFEGNVVPLGDAKVGIMTHALNYGTGCFEGIRGYWVPEDEQVYLFRAREHFERLHRSAHILRMKVRLDPAELTQLACDLVAKSGYREDVYVRPLVYKSAEQVGLSLVRKAPDGGLEDVEDDFFMFTVPFGAYLDLDKPIRVTISPWRRIDDNVIPPRAKVTGLYINSALATSQAKELGFDEAIMLNSDGSVSEGPGENIFMLRDGKLITTGPDSNILEGITRHAVMTLAREELGIEVVERRIARTELYIADELFFTGTAAQISAIGEVDGRTIGSGEIGPVAARLQEVFFDAVRNRNPKYADWCAAVYPVGASVS